MFQKQGTVNTRTLHEIRWVQLNEGKEVSCENAQVRGRISGSEVKGKVRPEEQEVHRTEKFLKPRAADD